MQVAALEVQHRAFLEKRERERGKWVDSKTKEPVTVTSEEIEEEKLRRKEIASLRMELYGERSGAYGTDPEWDDVIPMPVEDGEGALAAIAYPEEYAEGIRAPLLFQVLQSPIHDTLLTPIQPFPISAPSWPRKSTLLAAFA